jgi:hypothetical protein
LFPCFFVQNNLLFAEPYPTLYLSSPYLLYYFIFSVEFLQNGLFFAKLYISSSFHAINKVIRPLLIKTGEEEVRGTLFSLLRLKN